MKLNLDPYFLYGTAWKEKETARLVFEALQAGFRGFDTANQRRHYYEEGVGEGIARFLRSSGLKRADLFLQTKFTFRDGQDHRLPYDEDAPIARQVQQSFECSLQHLKTDYLDVLILHGPSSGRGVREADQEAWQEMEKLATAGKTRFLGLSNCNVEQIKTFFSLARIKPTFLQNRCYASRGWDKQNRAFCRENGVIYQGFSLLTANVDLMEGPTVQRIAKRYGKTAAQVIFRFARDIGMLPLTGTTDPAHMRQDLDIAGFILTPEEVSAVESGAMDFFCK